MPCVAQGLGTCAAPRVRFSVAHVSMCMLEGVVASAENIDRACCLRTVTRVGTAFRRSLSLLFASPEFREQVVVHWGACG
jgi:hypothetical protein